MKFVSAVFILTLAIVTGKPTTPKSGKGPALKVKVSQEGLNHASKVAIDQAASELLEKPPANQTGDFDISGIVIEYEVTEISVASFTKPESDVVVNEGQGITWSATGTSGSLTGKWKYNLASANADEEGSFEASVADVNFSMSASVAVDNVGRPMISVGECHASIASLRVELGGDGALPILFQFLRGAIQGFFREQLEKFACKFAVKYMNSDVRKKLQGMPVAVPFGNDMILDYRLTTSPQFGNSYVESEHKGEFRWRNELDGPNLIVHELPDSTTMTQPKMVYVWMSDYVVNSYLYTAHRHGLLQYSLAGDDLPTDPASVLSRTCPAHKFCLGTLIPELATKYANGTVSVNLRATRRPELDIIEGGIRVKITGEMSVSARNPGQKPDKLLTLTMSAASAVSVNVDNDNVTANFSNTSVKITGIYLSNGNITQGAFLTVLNTIIHSYIEPKVRAFGKQGIPLPEVSGMKYINPLFEVKNNILVIGADLDISP